MKAKATPRRLKRNPELAEAAQTKGFPFISAASLALWTTRTAVVPDEPCWGDGHAVPRARAAATGRPVPVASRRSVHPCDGAGLSDPHRGAEHAHPPRPGETARGGCIRRRAGTRLARPAGRRTS